LANSLIPIKGIHEATEAKLAALGIKNIPELLLNAKTSAARSSLAAKLRTSAKTVYYWAKQGELLRVSGMSANTANLLVLIGVRDVEDLARINIDTALALMRSCCDGISPAIKDFPAKALLTGLKNRAALMKPAISRDSGGPTPAAILFLPENDFEGGILMNNNRFRIEIDGIEQSSFFECTGLGSSIEVIPTGEGTSPLVKNLPGKTTYSFVKLKWNLSAATNGFDLYTWHKEALEYNLRRKNVAIILISDTGDDYARWHLTNAWPCAYEGPALSALGTEPAFETLTLACESIRRIG